MGQKLMSLKEAAALVQDGSLVALGGTLMHRSPLAFARELARQGKRDLQLVKAGGAYDIDLLCAAGCVAAVHAGFVGFEAEFGLAPNYRRMVEEGRVKACENACYTVIAGLRAAAYGLPFQPIAGIFGSDLLEAREFKTVKDPYTGAEVVAIPKLKPDWAMLHVQEADRSGNARIFGAPFEDVLMSRAAKGVILTAERIVETETFQAQPELTAIPDFLVVAVVEAKGGAWPGSCYPYYKIDSRAVREYLDQSSDPRKLREYLSKVDR
ncbi:MAG: CoA transferase subunit A [candidate division NC10 bacterium]|nr:CoA transferase subunit A [candidate division NC10 bacterium]